MKLGQKIYTPAEAVEVLGGLYKQSTLKAYAAAGKLPHYGGKGKGRLRFSENHLLQILEMNETKVESKPAKKTKKTADAEPSEVVELPDFFRQTSRSRARSRRNTA